MAEKLSCKKPQEHHLHLCKLQTSLTKAELAPFLENPKYVCAICGGRTHSGRNLCVPKRLGD